MRFLSPALLGACSLLWMSLLPAAAAGRTIVVLEHRAGVRALRGIGARLSREMGRLTSNRVISPTDAERKLGARLGARVAACTGDPACIARIGSRVGCQEVVLVGVSQLGDVIVTMQRIAVPGGHVLARLADSIHPRRSVRRTRLARYLRRLLPAADFKRYGKIAIRTEAVGDEVLLDGIPQGHTPLKPIVVPAPGRYTIRVRRPGHVDFVARLDVLPDAAVEVKPSLSPRGKATPLKWYERWWVWAIVGVVAGGATAAIVISATRTPDKVDAVIRWPLASF